jgi:hypothetical protein
LRYARERIINREKKKLPLSAHEEMFTRIKNRIRRFIQDDHFARLLRAAMVIFIFNAFAYPSNIAIADRLKRAEN